MITQGMKEAISSYSGSAHSLPPCSGQSVKSEGGGDEFIAVLPSQTCEKIAEKSQQLIHHIEEDVVSVKSSELRLSASIGIADFPAHSDSIEGLIQCADAAMYRAKS